MTFVARDFEKRLRRLHREELSGDPELRREFKSKRKSQKAATTRILQNACLPLFWACIFLAMIVRQENIGWAAGVIALWSIGTAFKWGNHWFQQFYGSEDLVVLNLLPLNDRQIFQFQLRRYLTAAGWIAWELALGYLALAFLHTEKSPPIYALPLTALVQTALVIALALHSASFLHMLPLGTIAGLFRFSAVVFLIVGLQGFEFVPSLVRATEWFLPTGWVNYMLLQTSRDWTILALAIPIVAIIYLARHSFSRLRTFYSLEGFEIIPGPAHVSSADDEELTPASFGHRAGPTEMEERISARHFLEGVNWNLGGALEKFVAKFLNSRERVVTEFLVAHDPGWTRSLKWSFWVWLFVCVVVLAFGQFGGSIVFFAAYVLGAASLPLFGGEWRGMRQTATGGVFIPGYALYPVTFNEMAWIFLKVNLIRICAAAPFIISFSAIAAYRLNEPAAYGAIIGSKLIAVLLCLQPLFVLLPISNTTNDTSRMTLIWLLVFMPAFLAILAGAVAVFMSATLVGIFGSFAVLLLLSSLLFAVYRGAYRSGRFDLLNPRSRGQIN